MTESQSSSNGHSAASIAAYILGQSAKLNRSITPLKLLKLAYIAHGWMLGMCGRPLIKDEIEAWKYGPVIPSLYHSIKDFRGSQVPVDHFSSAADVQFDAQEESILQQVTQKYGQFTAIQLSQLTHQDESPWDRVYYNVTGSRIIPNDLIENYYRKVYDERTSPSTQ